mgnify:CR=1 FL=1
MKEKLIANFNILIIVLIVIIITIIAAYIVKRFFNRLLKKSADGLNNDPTNYKFLRHTSIFMVYLTGFAIAIYSIPSLKTLASSMLAGAGIVAVAIGFAAQKALENIVSGVFIVLFKPFRVNDRVHIKGLDGTIEDITLRHTVIRDYTNNRIIIPNSVMSSEVLINSDYEDGIVCKWVNIGISYDSDLLKAKQIIKEEILNHPFHIDHRTKQGIEKGEEEVRVKLIGFGDSSVNLKGWAWANNFDNGVTMLYDLNESIKLRFDKEGIEIPYPYRTIVYKEPKKAENE